MQGLNGLFGELGFFLGAAGLICLALALISILPRARACGKYGHERDDAGFEEWLKKRSSREPKKEENDG